MIDLFDLLRTVWRNRVPALATLCVVLVATTVYLATQSRTYQSTVTLQLSSADPGFLSDINAVVPVYSALITSPDTLSLAQAMQGSSPLGSVSVRTFTDSPVLKLQATGASAQQAQTSAASVVKALRWRTTSSKLGVSGVSVATIDGPSPADVIWPRPALSLGVATLLGLLLAVLVGWLADRPWRSAVSPPEDEDSLSPNPDPAYDFRRPRQAVHHGKRDIAVR